VPMNQKRPDPEDKKCPKCGCNGETVNHREWRLGNSTKWFNEYRCPVCGHEWKREEKSSSAPKTS
jgi:DNA-directed RNA polymerase subunit M/transcription elongation factor TFIIS